MTRDSLSMPHALTRPVKVALVASTLVATAAVAQVGPAAAQSDKFSVRGIGITRLDVAKPTVNTLAVACVTPGANTFLDCVPQGSATLKVSAATKRKLKLPSTTIAKGPIVAKPAGGEGEDGGRVAATASSAVRKRLKKAKTIEVTYRLTVTSPIQEVLTEKVKMTTTSSGVQRLLLRSSGDTFSFGGGGRG
jgi:hypothetical protein